MQKPKTHETTLHKIYKGYSTDELLQMWEQIKGDALPKDTPREKISAMSNFLREYKLTPESRA